MLAGAKNAQESRAARVPALRAPAVLAVALALSIGWGVRGNWGHEYGAMIPGALAAMAAALVAGREDWRRRVAWFAFFGAVGWGFGGSMSYGRVLGYAHSDSLPDVLYGFASVSLIGFLWGAVGGAGTALPACLSRREMARFLPPLIVLFALWALWDYVPVPGALEWYGSDWISASFAVAVTLVFLAVRRRLDVALSLMLHMAVGWWAGMLILVAGLGLHMTPPRGDNWAGCLGMTAGMLVCLWRRGLKPVAFAGLLAGVFAGVGFSTGLLVRVAGGATGIRTNWHSVLEQSFGFISGLGVAVGDGISLDANPDQRR